MAVAVEDRPTVLSTMALGKCSDDECRGAIISIVERDTGDNKLN